MPSLDDNRRHWEHYDWGKGQGGDEWSQAWGGAASQWRSTIAPRLGGLLPTGRVLEIAPGYGRWTQFLLASCDELVGVDLANVCVEACRARFRGQRATFHTNDGSTLPMIAPASVDLVFSFDSLVHVDRDPLTSYIGEISRVLRPGGFAFLHHSNLAEVLQQGTAPEVSHWRSPEVSAAVVRAVGEAVGLVAVVQEMVNWGCSHPIDAFSLLQRPRPPEQPPAAQSRVNLDFMSEAGLASQRALLWAATSEAPARGVRWWRRLFS